ncbi:MAG: IS5 family transposase [Marinomonas primoryensis]|jgi:IS5 family transposase
MNFRHLLEKHKLSRQLFKEVKKWLSDTGIYLKEGTIVDATIIEAASSMKNKAKERDPEVHQTQKGKQWFFGLKNHIGVDARAGLTHSVSTTFMTSRKQRTFFMAKRVLFRRILAIVALKSEKS